MIRLGRPLVAALGIFFGMAVSPRAVSAHGELRSSQPEGGAHLAVAPRELRLVFNERVELAIARIVLRGPDSALVQLSIIRHGESASVLLADVLGPLGPGNYTVTWQIVGRDGHPVRGSFRFNIAPGAAGLGSPSAPGDTTSAATVPSPDTTAHHHNVTALPRGSGFGAESPIYAAIRWLGYVAMLGLIGVIGYGQVVEPLARQRRQGLSLPGTAALTSLGMISALALVVVAGARLIAQSVALHGVGDLFDAQMVGAMLTHTLWGRAWVLQVGAALAAVAGFALLARQRAAWVLIDVAALVSVVAIALSGHAAAVPGRAALAVTTDSLHILSAGGWLGTLAVLVLVGLRVSLRAGRDERGPAVAALVNAFSPVALTCAALVAGTGAISAWLHLGAISALWSSSYGRTLLWKLGILTLVVATGAYNWLRVRPSLGDEVGARRVMRSSTAELVIGVVVLVVTAVLVATPPAVDAAGRVAIP